MIEREEFEKWLSEDEGVVKYGAELSDSYIAQTWEAWQAATMVERERCALVAETYVNIDRQGVINKIRG